MSYETTWSDQKLNKNEINKLKTDGLDIFKALPELVKQPLTESFHGYYNRVGTAYFQVLLNQIIRETGDLT